MSRKLRVVSVLIAFSMTACGSLSADPISKVFQRVKTAVVTIHSEHSVLSDAGDRKFVSVPSLGSGVLISDGGQVITAAHVVQTADNIEVEFADGISVGARVIASEPAADIALVQLNYTPKHAVSAVLADSDAAEVGDQVFVVGAPYGISHTLTVGYISARHQPDITSGGFAMAEFFQTDAAINQGNSGGPMFNRKGQVVGIVSQILTQSGGSEGIGFAVTANTARHFLLEQKHAWTGILGIVLKGELAEAFHLPQPEGILVQSVARDSPAYRAGMRVGTIPAVVMGRRLLLGGDVILAVQGARCEAGTGYTLIRKKLHEASTGDIVRVTVFRAGEIVELSFVR